jgi:cyclophilin family peptidyl-prolyl cis-trans isomerase
MAPRQWCNAWRAVRDAVPAAVDAWADLVAATTDADEAPLPPAVASALRCDDASVLDGRTGIPEATLHCALPGHEALAAAAQAAVWGESRGPARVRAGALETLRSSARGDARILEAVAEAITKLPPPAAVPLIRRLAAERDPGVLAALLGGLVLHVQHARVLSPIERGILERAPFDLPEGPSLEARIHAITLARSLGDPEPGPDGNTRALRQAQQPDASLPATTRATPAVAAVVMRVLTDIGSFDVRIEPMEAPQAAAAVLGAVRSHQYDGLVFHRVVPGFVAQGLDPRGDGYGGTDQPVHTELSTRRFERGTVGIPLAGLDTGGIQLFVVLADAPHLDGRYPWIGRVERGMDVVDGLLPQDRVVRVEVLEDQNESPLRTSPR